MRSCAIDDKRPVAVELFAGAGGMSLGFEQAGFDVVAAVEIDPIHAATHHFNFPTTATIAKSVTDLGVDSLIEACHDKLRGRPVDVVFGGPPCQGFSLIGYRMLEDPRNHLVRHFLRLVVELDASYFVFENVRGLTVGKHRMFLESLIEEFGENGYDVLKPWQVLNAKNFGVPQDRERLFLIGARQGIPLPNYPAPITSNDPGLFDRSSVTPIPTCRDAIDDLPDNEEFDALSTSDSVAVRKWQPKSHYAREMHCETDGAWQFGYRRNWDPAILTSSMRTAHTDITRQRFESTAPGDVEPVSRFFKLPADGQSNTLRAGTDSARGAFTSPRPIHYKYNRCVSVREMARLHGYPDWFRFHVTKWHGARQIGNSVPPPLARAVAGSILQALNRDPASPDVCLDLGDPALLAMDMTEAAEFWKVENPIGRRNRKSGARKRRQHEVEAARLAADKPK